MIFTILYILPTAVYQANSLFKMCLFNDWIGNMLKRTSVVQCEMESIPAFVFSDFIIIIKNKWSYCASLIFVCVKCWTLFFLFFLVFVNFSVIVWRIFGRAIARRICSVFFNLNYGELRVTNQWEKNHSLFFPPFLSWWNKRKEQACTCRKTKMFVTDWQEHVNDPGNIPLSTTFCGQKLFLLFSTFLHLNCQINNLSALHLLFHLVCQQGLINVSVS